MMRLSCLDKWKRVNTAIAQIFVDFARRFPLTANFLGIIRRRRGPLKMIFLLAMHITGFFMSISALNQTRTEQGTVAWVLSLNLMPVIAVPAWIIFGDSQLDSYTAARRAGLEKVRPLADELMTGLRRSDALAHQPDGLMETLGQLASMPPISGNKVTLLVDGETTFDSIFNAIDEATDYILVQFYIVRNDATGKLLKEKLAAKASQGVRVYVLLDDIGCLDLGDSYVEELREAGVNARYFMDFSGGANRFQLNFRNHRKIVIVDGEKAYIGGHNVGDEYLGKHPVRTPWRDSHVLIEGPAVKAAQVPFVEDWQWATGEQIDAMDWEIDPDNFPGNMDVVILPSGPADAIETGSLMFLAAINDARERVWIATPYFVPDRKMISALQLAAVRGVEVKVLIPETTDSQLIQWSSYSYIETLEQSGVAFHRYNSGFLHQKVMLIDDHIAAVGSANFDNRSFRLNFEITSIIDDKKFAAEVHEMLTNDFSHSRKATSTELDDKSTIFKLAVRFARMLAPIQ